MHLFGQRRPDQFRRRQAACWARRSRRRPCTSRANARRFQVKGDVKINGTAAAVEFTKAAADPLGDLQRAAPCSTRRRAAGSASISAPAVTGNIPVKLTGRIGADDSKNKIIVDADFTPVKIDELLPGWVKPAGKPARVDLHPASRTPNPPASTISRSTARAASPRARSSSTAPAILRAANFPVFALSGGDQVSLRPTAPATARSSA